MNPDMMKMAMEQMANMSAEQMSNMSQMAANCSPSQLAEAQRMMGSMSPGQMADLQRQAAASGLGGAPPPPQQAAPPASEAVKEATKLKEAGNKLHQAADYKKAMRKYSQALEAMPGDESPAASALAKACNLNLAACALKSELYDKCAEYCDRVLKSDANNHKALYRRGQALLENGHVVRAEADLARALQFAPASDKAIMKTVLGRARAQLPASSQATVTTSVVVEDVTEEDAPPSQMPRPVQAKTSAGKGNANPMQQYAEMMRNPQFASMTENMLGNMSQDQLDGMAAAVGAPPINKRDALANMNMMKDMTSEGLAQQQFTPGQMPTQEQLQATAAQLQANPKMMEQTMRMMRGMSSEQLRQAAAQSGIPNISQEDLQMMQSRAENLRPEDLARLANQGAAAHAVKASSQPEQPQRQSAAAASRVSSTAPNKSPNAVQSSPGLSAPSKASGMPGGVPSTFGPLPNGFTAEMMQMASQMMGSMSPEQLSAMTSMAGGGGSFSAPAMGPDGMPQLSPEMMEQMQTPEMMAMAKDMMKNMDPDALASMMKQSGIDVSPEQAGAMKQQLDSLSPRQMWWLMTAATGSQRAAAAAKRLRDYLIANPQIAAAIFITLLLVLLRWIGIL